MNVKQYMAQIGARGGAAKSPAKSAAAVANGKRGGRPKRVVPSELAAVKK